MIYILIGLIIMLTVCMLVFKKKTLILFIATLLIILIDNDNNLLNFPLNVINSFQEAILHLQILFILLSIVLIYLISELSIILGLQNSVEKLLFNLSENNQKVSALVLSSFSSIFDLTTSKTLSKYAKIFNQSLTLSKTLNIISIEMLTIFSIITIISFSKGSEIFYIILLSNFFAIYFVIKRIIDFKNDKFVNYKYQKNRLKAFEVNAVTRNIHYNGLNMTLIRSVIYIIVLTTVFTLLSTPFYFSGFIVLFLIFIDFFVSSIVFSIKQREIKEKYIYTMLFGAFKRIIKKIVFIAVSLFYIQAVSESLVSNTMIYDLTLSYTVIFFIVLASIITILLYDYIVALVIIIPVFIHFMQSSFFHIDHIAVISFLIGLVIFINHLIVLDYRKKDKKLIIDIMFNLFFGLVAYGLFFITNNLFIPYIFLIIILFIYLIYSKITTKRVIK